MGEEQQQRSSREQDVEDKVRCGTLCSEAFATVMNTGQVSEAREDEESKDNKWRDYCYVGETGLLKFGNLPLRRLLLLLLLLLLNTHSKGRT